MTCIIEVNCRVLLHRYSVIIGRSIADTHTYADVSTHVFAASTTPSLALIIINAAPMLGNHSGSLPMDRSLFTSAFLRGLFGALQPPQR